MTDNGNIWADKFIKRELIPAGELAQRFNINNPRLHPESQRAATESSLDTVGWIDEVSLSTNGDGPPSLADNPDAVMFDGHERVEIALVRGGPDTLVPVNWYQLTPEETDFALFAKDQTSAMAQIDPVKMADLMERTKAMTTAPGLQGMLERLKEQVADGLLAQNGNGAGTDTPPAIDKAAELQEKWQVQPGQLWELGEHRIVCGDCTDAAVVERVMGRERAVLCATSPPYHVGKEYEQNQTWKEFINLIGGFIAISANAINDGGYLFINFSENTNKPIAMAELYRSLAIKAGFNWHSHRVWRRPSDLPIYCSTTPRPNNEIEYLHTYKKGNGSEKVRNIKISHRAFWETNGPEQLGHTAAFPVELIEKPVIIYSDDNDVIFDPFLGSGTTLIACQNLGRRCRGIEIHPPYVSVCLQRFLDHTGIQPRLLETVEA